jgi:hypothetical protein
MMRNKVYAIVEGHGEAGTHGNSPPAVVVLIGRILNELQCHTLFPGNKRRCPPFRLSYGQFFRSDHLERALRAHRQYDDCAAVLILLDMEDDCPRTQAGELTARIRSMEPLPFSVVVVCAYREYETWFLSSLDSIKCERYPEDPEVKRDAKGWLRQRFGYKPTRDQAKYTEKIDPALASQRSRSFRRLRHALEQVIDAFQQGRTCITP